jgi:hypothetical protein
MVRKWIEVRRQLTPEAEERIRQRVHRAGQVIALLAVELDPQLRELAATDPEAYLRNKEASGESEPSLSRQ